MKAKCIKSHVLPLGEGRFKAYVKDAVYEIDETGNGLLLEAMFFEAVEEEDEADAEQAAE